MSGDGWQGSRRGIDNAADEVAVGQARGGRSGGKAGIGVEAGIDVNLEDPRLAFTIDAAGDFVGRGVWTLIQDGPTVSVTYAGLKPPSDSGMIACGT